ncbi:MAG TPA: hypothetical protein EYP62_08930 [Kiritimatiellae bacterium]|nr:hypothetical protein [Kiritimatiellia bacterium]
MRAQRRRRNGFRSAAYMAPVFLLAVAALIMQYRWVQRNRYKFTSPARIRIIRCDHCGGSGEVRTPGGRLEPCPICFGGGSRIVRRYYEEDRLCPVCAGMGRIISTNGMATTCPRCGGRGMIRSSVARGGR